MATTRRTCLRKPAKASPHVSRSCGRVHRNRPVKWHVSWAYPRFLGPLFLFACRRFPWAIWTILRERTRFKAEQLGLGDPGRLHSSRRYIRLSTSSDRSAPFNRPTLHGSVGSGRDPRDGSNIRPTVLEAAKCVSDARDVLQGKAKARRSTQSENAPSVPVTVGRLPATSLISTLR